jgi:glycosyltransferase involved in cell wall biosynthesis
MKVLISAVAAKMGGAANYTKELARSLALLDQSDEFLFLVPPGPAATIGTIGGNIRAIATEAGFGGIPRRVYFDQVQLRRLVKEERIDVLYSSANFAMFHCPCRQVLLVRNPLYFCDAYLKRVLPHAGLKRRVHTTLRRWLNCRSIDASDLVMTPTKAMMDDVSRFADVPGHKSFVNHYGVDTHRFLPPAKPIKSPGPVRLLFSSLYGEHKNLSTLFRAAAILAEWGLDFRLVTPADPSGEDAQWTCTWREDAELAAVPQLRGRVEFTPKRSSDQMPALYWSSDIFVYPSPVESFGHPLIEALAAELPVVAADTPLNRELAGDAAVYFDCYDPQDFARQIQRVYESPELQKRMIVAGRERCSRFTWKAHAERLLLGITGYAPSRKAIEIGEQVAL